MTLTLDSILDHKRREDAQLIESLLRKHGPNATAVFAARKAEGESAPTIALFRKGLNIVWSCLNVADDPTHPEAANARILGLDLAVLLVRTYARPEGGFLEYDHSSWVPREDMWRTIPWGSSFHGHAMLQVSHRIGSKLPDTERLFWINHLQKTGAWIYRNPICGSFVFNCGLHLLSLLWLLGKTFRKPEWREWALASAGELVRRDVDHDGWITGEDGGVSGIYQLLGSVFLAQLARESGDPLLQQVSRKMFALHTRFASREKLMWAGNFGTRSGCFTPIYPGQVLEEAAAGNGHAAAILRRHATLDWAGGLWHTQPLFDAELWQKALQTEPEPEPFLGPSENFPGINSTVVRAGGFHAWFFNYQKSVWARGFSALAHTTGPVFATLHSLPTQVEKTKLLLGDTTDWAGFPHIKIEDTGGPWHSHQAMSPAKVSTGEGVLATWTEDLVNHEDGIGGHASHSIRFDQDSILVSTELTHLCGIATLDYHLQRENDKFVGYWLGEEVQAIRAGKLPVTGGQYWCREFDPAHVRLATAQLETTLYTWELLEVPPKTLGVIGLRKTEGLHSQNLGGIRLRLHLPKLWTAGTVLLRFTISQL